MSRNSTRCKVTCRDHRQPAPRRPRPPRRPPVGRRPRAGASSTTAERLLEERPFADISVDDLAKGAGLSRPTFYFYFPSKDAVLLTLFERVIAEADAAFDGAMPTDCPTIRDESGATASTPSSTRSRAHRAVTRAGTEAGPPTPRCASCGRRSCRSGSTRPPRSSRPNAPAGAAPDTIAGARPRHLAEPDERARDVRVVRRREARRCPRTASLDTLAHIWLTSIYGERR